MFILAQIAWLSLVGLWIYWYVSNYVILQLVGEQGLPQIVSKSTNLLALVWGLILLVLVLGGMYFVFIYLTKQINITRMYDSFIANVSHELKSPLASIQLYLETLGMREVPKEKQREFLDSMTRDANRLQNLINSILDISVMEQKKMAFNFKSYSAGELVHELLESSLEQFRIPKEAFSLKGTISCQIRADRNALKIVFDNLIDNTLKYTVSDYRLIVSMACKNKKLILEFTDKGIGISAKDQKNVFKKFHRISGNHIPNIRGTGLGLFIVREIVKAHGGKISVYSAGENRGSTFRIELPIHQKKEWEDSKSS